MSEFTFGFLVKNEGQNDELVRKIVNTTYVKELNEDWLVFIEGNWDVPQSVLELSREIPVLKFENAEDHGWGFSIFNNGEEITTIEISYELEDKMIMLEVERRHPEIEDMTEFIYFDPKGREIYAQIQKELPNNELFAETVRKQFNLLNTQSFELFQVGQDKINELNQILTSEYYINLKNKYEVVNRFKEILNLEEMSWIRPDRLERFEEEDE